MEPIRIVVADDHSVVREGLIVIINAQPDMLVVAAGQDAIGEIRKTFRDARIIVMTSCS